ncbi:aldo/keto reductase [Paenibacillus solisilvae]|uniref:Aldo/keto reductase n=1 Tax=Paenibacillus solisilvae TaxID=2486751 RepID=A0ABW0VPP7_9BACL
MEKRRLGQTDMQVSVLGFGGAEIGFEQASAETVKKVLESALDAGLNMIDTAECYKESEALIGKTVSHRRKDYYLFSKCGHASGFDSPDWDLGMLADSIDRSLERLQTDYIDLMQLHGCSEEILRQGGVIEVLQRAKEAGKIRYLGYSGDGPKALYAVQCGAFDTLQTSISIADQEALELTIPEAQKRGMGIIAKRPIANVVWKFGEIPDNSVHKTYWERLQELDYGFLKTDLNSSVETALRFTLSVPGVGTAIVGTSNPDRWVSNAVLANKGVLPSEQLEAIRDRWSAVSAGRNWIGMG